jgi:putative sterol carrier protein
MPSHLNTEAAGDLEAVYQFEVNGVEDFTAHIRITQGSATFTPGTARAPDLTICTPADVCLGISRGEIGGQAAFMDGRYTAEGDLNLLMRMSRLFRRQAAEKCNRVFCDYGIAGADI